MKKFLLSFILISNFSFSQVIDYQGFMDFSYNDDSGKIILEIDNLDNEFLYINSLSRGVGNNDLGLDRGQLGNSRIVYFTKRGNKILYESVDFSTISKPNNTDLAKASSTALFSNSLDELDMYLKLGWINKILLPLLVK